MKTIYAYKKNDEIVYIGKSYSENKHETYHMNPVYKDSEQINQDIQKNPSDFQYIVLQEEDDTILDGAMDLICQKYLDRYEPVYNGYVKEPEIVKKKSKPKKKVKSKKKKYAIKEGLSVEKVHGKIVFVYTYVNDEGKAVRLKHRNHDILENRVRKRGLSFIVPDDFDKQYQDVVRRKNGSGFYHVFKKECVSCVQGFRWVYYYDGFDGVKSLSSVDLGKLEFKVKSRGLPWFRL